METWKRGNALKALEPKRKMRVIEIRCGIRCGECELGLKRPLDLEKFAGVFVNGGNGVILTELAAFSVEIEKRIVPRNDRRVEHETLQHLGMRETGKLDPPRGNWKRQ